MRGPLVTALGATERFLSHHSCNPVGAAAAPPAVSRPGAMVEARHQGVLTERHQGKPNTLPAETFRGPTGARQVQVVGS